MNASEASTGCIIAPGNFSQVESGVYRSACPGSKNISFLKTLGLKTVVNLTSNCVPDEVKTFYEQMWLERGKKIHYLQIQI